MRAAASSNSGVPSVHGQNGQNGRQENVPGSHDHGYQHGHALRGQHDAIHQHEAETRASRANETGRAE